VGTPAGGESEADSARSGPSAGSDRQRAGWRPLVHRLGSSACRRPSRVFESASCSYSRPFLSRSATAAPRRRDSPSVAHARRNTPTPCALSPVRPHPRSPTRPATRAATTAVITWPSMGRSAACNRRSPSAKSRSARSLATCRNIAVNCSPNSCIVAADRMVLSIGTPFLARRTLARPLSPWGYHFLRLWAIRSVPPGPLHNRVEHPLPYMEALKGQMLSYTEEDSFTKVRSAAHLIR
jgi:hypothetical protein